MTLRAYVCTRLLLGESIYFGAPRGYGAVDVRPAGGETPSEARELNKSLEAWAESANLDTCMRLTTVSDGFSSTEAMDIAEVRFEEALDILHQELFFARPPRLSRAGVIVPLHTGIPEAILPKRYMGPAPVFQRSDALIEELSQDRLLLAVPPTEVAVRLKRAAHWTRLANTEKNPVLQVVFRWFLIEGLCNFDQTDPAATSRALLTVGVFTKSIGRNRPALIQNLINKVPEYKHFSKRVKADMEKLQRLRHSTVHDAAHTMEVDKELLKRLSLLTSVLAPRVKKRLMDAFFEYQPTTIKEAWSLVEAQVTSDPNLSTKVAEVISLLDGP